MNETTATGRCLCGNIKFHIHGEPKWVGHCHCESCRRNTGAAVATFLGLRPAQVTYTSGERQFFHSSPGVRRGFCGQCGTPLTYESDRFADEVHFYLCTVDDPQIYRAQFHVFYGERVRWFHIEDELPKYVATSSGTEI